MTGPFVWLYDAHLEVGSCGCLSLCWEPGSLPPSPLFLAWGCTCSGLWPQTCPGTHPCSSPEPGVWQELAHSQSEERAMGLSGSAALHLFPETRWVYPSLVSLLPPSSVLLHAKVLHSHLPIWASYSVPKQCALQMISHSPCPAPVQLGPSIPNPWLFI